MPLSLCAKDSDVYIGVSAKYNPDNLPAIGLAGFFPLNPQDNLQRQTASSIGEVVRADLMRSRYFDVKDDIAPADLRNISASLEAYKKQKVDYALLCQVSPIEGGWDIKAFLYDTESVKTVFAKDYRSGAKSLRRVAHLISDQIVLMLTGKKGIADTRIAFCNSSTGHKEIYMVDYDGFNLKKLTRDNSIALLPRWSSDGTKIFYTTYRRGNPDIFYIDLKESKIKPLIKGGGLNLIGGVSPDDRKIVLTMSRGTNPSIYLKELDSGLLSRLTNSYAVDGSPSFSPDGKFVTFISNRSGNPQVYILNLDTKETRRLTKMNWTDTPQWSPDGQWIVFSGKVSYNHPIDIFIVDITGGQLRQLTADSGSNEDPTWSPDGRFIAYTTTRNHKRQIYEMDADGSAQHLIANVRGDSFTPNWSK